MEYLNNNDEESFSETESLNAWDSDSSYSSEEESKIHKVINCNNSADFDDLQWKIFCKNFKTTHSQLERLTFMNFNHWTAKQCAEFFDILSYCSQFNTLHYDYNENNLEILNEEQWEAFACGIAKHRNLHTLSFVENNLNEMSSNNWRIFWRGIFQSETLCTLNLSTNNLNALKFLECDSSSQILHLNLSGNKLGNSKPGEWRIFFQSIAKCCPKLHTLNLEDNDLDQLSSHQWDEFFNSMAEYCPNIQKLKLGYNNLNSLTFFKSPSPSHILDLDLSFNCLGNSESGDWTLFFQRIAECCPKLHTLNLQGNFLNQLSPQKWKEFFGGIAQYCPQLSMLSLDELDKFGEKTYNVFREELAKCTGIYSLSLICSGLDVLELNETKLLISSIIDSQIHTLNLSNNHLSKWKADKTTLFFDDIPRSKIHTLSLSDNKLSKWKADKIAMFFDGIAKSKIHTLNLSYNNLSTWKANEIKVFFKGLARSKIHTLNLAFNNFKNYSQEQ